MSDSTIHNPAQFSLRARYVRVLCDFTDSTGNQPYAGLWMEVRRNLVIGERAELLEQLKSIRETQIEAVKALRAEAEELDKNRPVSDDRTAAEFGPLLLEYRIKVDEISRRRGAIDDADTRAKFALLAPHVRAWNLGYVDADGSFVTIPPPAVGGIAVMDEMETELIGWMQDKILEGYRLGFPIGSVRSGVSLEPTRMPDASETMSKTAKPGSPRSPRKSASPSA